MTETRESEFNLPILQPNRRLAGTQQRPTRISLTEWMTKHAELSKARLPQVQEASLGRKNRAPSSHKDSIGAAMRATGMPALQKKPFQLGLEDSRRCYPQLRWPRRPKCKHICCGASSFASSKEFQSDWGQHDKNFKEWLECAEPDAAEDNRRVQDSLPSMRSTWTASSGMVQFMSDTGTFSGFSRKRWLKEQQGELMPPKRRPKEEPLSCSTATVHLPQLRAGAAPCDRKYHLRQAPISQVIAKCPVSDRSSKSKNARPLWPDETADQKAVKTTSGQYLIFESWGLDDAYLTSLFQQLDIQEIEHLNVSDNRITNESISFMAERFQEMACKPWQLRSLHLAKNRLKSLPEDIAI